MEQDPHHHVDVALFDSYGQPGLGLPRVTSLVHSTRVSAVAVYTWSLSQASRHAALRAGARGLIAKALPAQALVDARWAVGGGQLVDTGGFRGGTQGP